MQIQKQYKVEDMKAGATRSDQNRIREYAESGMNAQEISRALGIKLECIESFLPKKKKASKKKEVPEDTTIEE